jgi:hypothetical protein
MVATAACQKASAFNLQMNAVNKFTLLLQSLTVQVMKVFHLSI